MALITSHSSPSPTSDLIPPLTVQSMSLGTDLPTLMLQWQRIASLSPSRSPVRSCSPPYTSPCCLTTTACPQERRRSMERCTKPGRLLLHLPSSLPFLLLPPSLLKTDWSICFIPIKVLLLKCLCVLAIPSENKVRRQGCTFQFDKKRAWSCFQCECDNYVINNLALLMVRPYLETVSWKPGLCTTFTKAK